MRYLMIITLLAFSPFGGFAQQKYFNDKKEFDDKVAKFSTPNIVFENYTLATLEQYLAKNYPSANYGNFKIENTIKSQTATHYFFKQYFNNVEVYRGSLKLSVNNQNRLFSVVDFLYQLPDVEISEVKNPNVNEYIGQALLAAYPIKSSIKEVFYVKDGNLRKGTLVNYSSTQTIVGDKEVLFDANAKEIYVKDKSVYHSHFSDTDTTVKVKIFRPDPLSSANVTYGGAYIDSNDGDVSVLNAQLFDTEMGLTFANDTFYLQSAYCNLGEFDLPNKPICYALTDSMVYTRANDCFEQINVFYYINYFQEYLQSLGFTNLGNHPIKVDAQGWNGQDQSSFSPSEDLLSFGEGGVDDGEDVDVILHEYQHALASYAAPNSNSGGERLCLDEANGDYLAASFSRSVEEYTWDKVFTWDGHNAFWAGRKATSNKVYSENLSFGNFYAHTDLWASTLMQIWEDIGRENADKILIESLYGYSSGLKLDQAAKLYLMADSNLNSGANAIPIIARFCARNLLTTECGVLSPTKLKNLKSDIIIRGNFQGSNLLEIETNKMANVKIFSLEGKIVSTENSIENSQIIKINTSHLASGVYLLQLETDSNTYNFKIIK